MLRILRRQKGTALPLALILLGIGSTLIVPMLYAVSSSLLAVRSSDFASGDGYAADAGVEDAIWNLAYSDLASTQIPNEEDTTSYQLGDTVNGNAINVCVTNKGTIVAAEDFESNSWSGGSGWLNNWISSGDAEVGLFEQPFEGNYHVRIRDDDGYVKRAVDISDQPNPRLKFWARVKIFESGDQVELKLSTDGNNWNTANTWAIADSDDIYHYFDIDLSSYAGASQLWIAFDADMTNGGDKFFIDDLKIVHSPVYEIVVSANEHTDSADITIESGVVTILSWEKDSTSGVPGCEWGS